MDVRVKHCSDSHFDREGTLSLDPSDLGEPPALKTDAQAHPVPVLPRCVCLSHQHSAVWRLQKPSARVLEYIHWPWVVSTLGSLSGQSLEICSKSRMIFSLYSNGDRFHFDFPLSIISTLI